MKSDNNIINNSFLSHRKYIVTHTAISRDVRADDNHYSSPPRNKASLLYTAARRHSKVYNYIEEALSRGEWQLTRTLSLSLLYIIHARARQHAGHTFKCISRRLYNIIEKRIYYCRCWIITRQKVGNADANCGKIYDVDGWDFLCRRNILYCELLSSSEIYIVPSITSIFIFMYTLLLLFFVLFKKKIPPACVYSNIYV